MKRMLLAEETLFRDEESFSFDHVPDVFSFRDNQLNAMAAALKPAKRNRKAANLLLIGGPATGKTTAVKIIFEQLSGPVCVRINSEIAASPYRVFSEIHRKILGFLPPDTGISLPAIYDKIFGRLLREKKYLVVALDDVQYLLSDMNKVLYDLLRAGESYPGAGVSVIAVTDKNIMQKLDDKVRSVFQPQEIRFPEYTAEETFQILKQRRDAGLYPGVLEDSLLREIAAAAYAKHDIRLGIEAVRKAAVNAEAEASPSIERKHIVLEEASLPKEESELLAFIPAEGIKSGDLYAHVEEKMGYTKFYRVLQRLEAAGAIEAEAIRGAGNSRLIKKR
ncbi:MAG: AAA family ATPase [Candidatus Aenigmarchaeota archaeon]|nr:AAA family ATPase [Candidatus Aenigmarchaeota archaeon]